MKSAPGRSVVYTSTRAGGVPVSKATCVAEGRGAEGRGAWACCALTAAGCATSAAAPAAAPFRNPRRPKAFFFAILSTLLRVPTYPQFYYGPVFCSYPSSVDRVAECGSGETLARPKSGH